MNYKPISQEDTCAFLAVKVLKENGTANAYGANSWRYSAEFRKPFILTR